jgi:hypothetical protein
MKGDRDIQKLTVLSVVQDIVQCKSYIKKRSQTASVYVPGSLMCISDSRIPQVSDLSNVSDRSSA